LFDFGSQVVFEFLEELGDIEEAVSVETFVEILENDVLNKFLVLVPGLFLDGLDLLLVVAPALDLVLGADEVEHLDVEAIFLFAGGGFEATAGEDEVEVVEEVLEGLPVLEASFVLRH
jgi:hypothetical protein